MRRIVFAVLLAATVVGVSLVVAAQGGDDGGRRRRAHRVEPRRPRDLDDHEHTTTTTTLPTPNSDGELHLVRTVTGDISPKSVVASGRGQVFAQNMMYKHSVTVYDEAGDLVTHDPRHRRPLRVRRRRATPGSRAARRWRSRSAPTARRRTSPTTRCTASGWGPEGSDECHPSDGYDRSYVYRVDVKTLKIDNVILVGSVPKYVATTPDGRYVIVTNWCTFDASIIDVATQTEVKRIPLGPYPRGIVVTPDSRTAYIAVMGSTTIARIDLTNLTTSWISTSGSGPRHLVLSPDGRTLYATLNGEGRVAKIDPVAGAVQAKVATGSNPRSMTISADGKYLFVVNYESGTMSKLDANTMADVQTVRTGYPPDRHHLRPPDQRRVGGELHGLDHDLQQRLSVPGASPTARCAPGRYGRAHGHRARAAGRAVVGHRATSPAGWPPGGPPRPRWCSAPRPSAWCCSS